MVVRAEYRLVFNRFDTYPHSKKWDVACQRFPLAFAPLPTTHHVTWNGTVTKNETLPLDIDYQMVIGNKPNP